MLLGGLVSLVLAAVVAIGAPSATAQTGADSVVFHVALSGDTGGGTAILRFEPASNTLCYVIVVRGIGEPTEPAPGLGSAHIHGPLPATGIAVHLDAEWMQAGVADVYLASGCVDVDAATLDAILANPELFYVNIHTVAQPGGALRGSLG